MHQQKFRFCIPEGTQVGQRDIDENDWTCYEVYNASAHTLCDFLHGMEICEMDRNGNCIATLSFHDAPILVQATILRLTGLNWKDVENCEIPAPAPEPKKRRDRPRDHVAEL